MKRLKLPFLLALLHTLVLALYAFPSDWVPERLRYWSTTYTRPLFHQQWNLFAPDVPPCACTIEVERDGDFVDLMDDKDLIGRRLVKWGCRLMPNYRDPSASTGALHPWSGFEDFTDALDDSFEQLPARVRRSCISDSVRVIYHDALK